NFIKWITKKLVTSIKRSIRIQLITTFIACALLGFTVSRMVVPIFENINKVATIDYSSDMESINQQAQLAAEAAAKENTIEAIKKFINEQNEDFQQGLDDLKEILKDATGTDQYTTDYAQTDQIDVFQLSLDAIKVLVTYDTWKLLNKTDQAQEVQIDLHNTIGNVMSFAINHPSYTSGKEQLNGSRTEFITFYPLKIKDKNLYMF